MMRVSPPLSGRTLCVGGLGGCFMIAGGLGSPKKKYLCLYFGISYLIVNRYLHQTIEQQGIDA